MVMLVLIVAGTMTEIVIVFVIIILKTTIRILNTDTNADSNASRRNNTKQFFWC